MSVTRNRLLLVLGGIIALLIAIYVIALMAAGSDVRRGTTVSGVEIGGMSTQEAIDELNATVGVQATKPLKVKSAEKSIQVLPAYAGLTFDAAATVASATGRTINPLALITGLFGHHSVAPVTSVDQDKLDAQVTAIAAEFDHPPVEPSITVTKTKVRTKPGKPGAVLDQGALADALQSEFMNARTPIRANLAPAAPEISDATLNQAQALARTAISAPVPVTVQSTPPTDATIPATAIGQALSFVSEGDQLNPVLDGAILHDSIAKQLKGTETKGRDATFRIVAGKPQVVPSVVGNGVSDEELSSQVLTVIGNNPPNRAVTVTMGVREPALTTEEAQQLGVTERISTFTQHFPYAAYRVQNVGRAAKYINGTLLLPGQTFSMNDTIKERTEKNGYTKGFVVGPGGVFAEELGGGVSTATTTTWVGAFYAGMERVHTQAHSIYISRYQAGLEATVGWGLFDMKFRNDTPYGVFITTKMTNTSMQVNYWSTRIWSDIKAEFGPRQNIRPYATIYDKSPECLGQAGVDGFTIDVARVFYKDGVEAKREVISTSYRPAPEVICGKKPKPCTLDQIKANGEPKKAANCFIEPVPSPSGSAKPSGKPSASASAGSDPAPTMSESPTSKPRKPKPTASSTSG